MKITGGINCFIFALLFVAQHLNAQWVSANKGLPAPKVGQGKFPNITCFVINGNIVFAGSTQGVFVSGDNGNSWTSGTGLPAGIEVRDITSSGVNTFIATDNGIYFSGNNGKLWKAANKGLPLNPYDAKLTNEFKTVAISGSIIIAGCHNQSNGSTIMKDGGIYISADNGKSWTLSVNGIQDPVDGFNSNCDIEKIVVSGNTIYAISMKGIFSSTDNGKNWSKVCDQKYKPLIVSGKDIYGGSWGSGVYRSSDNAKTFNSVNTGIKNPAYVDAIAANGNYIFAGIESDNWKAKDLLMSGNNGASWSKVEGWKNDYVNAITFIGNTVFVGTNNGILMNSTLIKK